MPGMVQEPQDDSNPYASPRHASGGLLPSDQDRPRFRILAVIVGWLVDVISSNVAGLALGIVLGVVLIAQGVGPERLQQVLSDSAGLQVAGLVIGFCGTILGGYVAAWMAKHWEMRHALAMGLLSLATAVATVSLLSFSPIPMSQPTWSNAIVFTGTVPAACLGGWLRRTVARRKRR